MKIIGAKYELAATVLASCLLMFTVFAAVSAPVNAQEDVFQRICNRREVRNLPKNKRPTACQEKDQLGGQNPLYGPNGVITRIVNVLTIIVGIAAVIAIITAGFKYITSGSNPQEVTTAREIIIYAAVAVLVAALAQLMVRFVLSEFF